MPAWVKFARKVAAGFISAVFLLCSAEAQVPQQFFGMFNSLRQLQQQHEFQRPTPPAFQRPTRPVSTLSQSSVGGAPNIFSSKPTIDCSKTKTPLGLILCTDENAARADWDVNASGWAYAFTLEERPRKAFWQSHDEWVQSVTRKCNLTVQISNSQRECVVRTYRARANALRSKLTGDALVETRLSPEERAAIQTKLAAFGFLADRPDGEFGANTRAAIKKFQQANRYREAAFLTAAQRQALLASVQVAQSPAQTQATQPPERLGEAAVPVAPPPAQTVTNLPDERVCRDALNPNQTTWDKNPTYSMYIEEATRRGFTADSCRQLLRPAATNQRATAADAQADSASTLNPPVRTAPESSTQPVQQSTTTEFGSVKILVFLAMAVGVIWAVVNFFKRAKQARVQDAISKALISTEAAFPFLFVSHWETNITALCMDQHGERLRLLGFNIFDGMKTIDRNVPVSSIISVELAGGDEVVTDYETTSTKPNALAGAILGGLLFGRTGAIVGATAAGSEGTTVATRRVVEKPSVLVFELSDLNNPVMRFHSMDRAQCDLWLHRVRSAMARQAKALASLTDLPTGQGTVAIGSSLPTQNDKDRDEVRALGST
jgi:hypothetical protein